MREALSLRTWTQRPLLIATGILAVALMLALSNPRGGHTAPPASANHALTSVMVAAHRIAGGTVITPADIRAKVLTDKAPTGAILSAQAALGRMATRNLARGDMLLQDSLRDTTVIGLAARVPPGERAFSIRVAEDEIVGGFLQSGDRVDLFAIIPGSVFPAKDVQRRSDHSQAVLLLQNVLVLAVGENPATRGSVQASAHTVSLSLPPAQLVRLALAQRFGKVSLAIRRPGDDALTDRASATLRDLVPSQALPAPALAPADRHVAGVPIYLGTRAAFAPAGASQ